MEIEGEEEDGDELVEVDLSAYEERIAELEVRHHPTTTSFSSAKMSEKGDSLCGRAVVLTRPGCLGRREGAKRPAPGQGTPHPPLSRWAWPCQATSRAARPCF